MTYTKYRPGNRTGQDPEHSRLVEVGSELSREGDQADPRCQVAVSEYVVSQDQTPNEK